MMLILVQILFSEFLILDNFMRKQRSIFFGQNFEKKLQKLGTSEFIFFCKDAIKIFFFDFFDLKKLSTTENLAI